MSNQRPSAVVFASAYQVLLGLIWLWQLGSMPGTLLKLLVASIAFGHWYAAAGLYMLAEWGRQRTLQFAMFDLLSVLPMALSGQISPWGAMLQLGMPIYMIHALNETRVREKFS